MEETRELMNSSLRISMEENDELCLEDNLILEGKKASRYSLVGKLLTKKAYNRRSLFLVMKNF